MLAATLRVRPVKLLRIGVPRIDWTHPLSRGLVGCYLPGVSLGWNLTRLGSDLTFAANGNAPQALSNTKEGPARTFASAQTGLNGTATTALMPTQAASAYWRGTFLGAPTSKAELATVWYGNATAPPYGAYAMCTDGNNIIIYGSNNGSYVQQEPGASPIVYGTMQGFLATFQSGGNMVLYSGAASVVSGSFGAGPITYSGSPNIIMAGGSTAAARIGNYKTNLVAFWNRALSAAEAAQLDADPYAFLIFPPDEMFAALKAPGAFTWQDLGQFQRDPLPTKTEILAY